MTLDEIYVKYGKLVYNLVLKYVQNIQEAEELTQDVFVAINTNLVDFRKDAEMKTWIYRIAINRSLDHLKAKKRKKRFAYVTSLFESEHYHKADHCYTHPYESLEQKEAIAHIYKVINDLPDNQKTAIILSKLENKSQKEVAEIMNLSTKAVESLLQRAKTNLTKKLKVNEGKG